MLETSQKNQVNSREDNSLPVDNLPTQSDAVTQFLKQIFGDSINEKIQKVAQSLGINYDFSPNDLALLSNIRAIVRREVDSGSTSIDIKSNLDDSLKVRYLQLIDGLNRSVTKVNELDSADKGVVPLTQEVIKQLLHDAYFITGPNGELQRKFDQDDALVGFYTNPVPGEIGRNFDAHGIAKGGIFDQFNSLISFLTNGPDPERTLHSAPLSLRDVDPKSSNTPGGHAYYDGSFILLAEPGKSLDKDGIKFVLVNENFYHAIETLQRAFPDVEFIAANKAPKRLTTVYTFAKGNE